MDYFLTDMYYWTFLKRDLEKICLMQYVSFRISINSPDFGCSYLSPTPGQWHLFFFPWDFEWESFSLAFIHTQRSQSEYVA